MTDPIRHPALTEAIESAIGLNVDCGGTQGVHRVRDAVLDAIQPELDALTALRQIARGYCPECGRGDAAPTVTDWEQQRDRADQAEADRDGAYRERAQLLALLAALHPSVIAPAPDIDEDGWQILYLRIGGKQASWHIAPRDTELYAHVEHVPADDRRAQWDGHTTEEKYAHIGQHAARLYAQARGRVETPLTTAEARPASWLLEGSRDLSIPAQHRITAHPVTPEMERAATERARQAAADSERAAAWIAAQSGPAAAEQRADQLAAGIRNVIADMHGVTGARHWIAALERILDQP